MSAGKSGIRVLKPNEVLFEDGEHASSLYIIQSGQLRLYKPKGKGFVEIAVLRTGEVIGEMAYFDDNGSSRRSCAASAMITSEVIEISFSAFAKTMSGLNPWFKTIINTLVKRLKVTNARVKELESNSASLNYGSGKVAGYEFLKANDIMKILGTFFLMYKAHGEKHNLGLAIHRKTIDLYMRDIYSIMEVKLDELVFVLVDMGLMEILDDKDGLPKIYILKNIEAIKSLFVFYNTEKHIVEEEKLKILPAGVTFLKAIWKETLKMEFDKEEKILVPIKHLIEGWKTEKAGVTLESLDDAREHSLVGDVILDGGGMFIEVFYLKLKRQLPHIKFVHLIQKLNESKSN